MNFNPDWQLSAFTPAHPLTVKLRLVNDYWFNCFMETLFLYATHVCAKELHRKSWSARFSEYLCFKVPCQYHRTKDATSQDEECNQMSLTLFLWSFNWLTLVPQCIFCFLRSAINTKLCVCKSNNSSHTSPSLPKSHYSLYTWGICFLKRPRLSHQIATECYMTEDLTC